MQVSTTNSPRTLDFFALPYEIKTYILGMNIKDLSGVKISASQARTSKAFKEIELQSRTEFINKNGIPIRFGLANVTHKTLNETHREILKYLETYNSKVFRLNLEGFAFTDHHVRELMDMLPVFCPNINYLKISSHCLRWIPCIAKLKQLEELDISNCSFLRFLPGITNALSLKSINILGCQSLYMVDWIPKLTNLETLGVHLFYPDGKIFKQGFSKLKSLDINESRYINEKELDIISALPQLETLILPKIYCKPKYLKKIVSLKTLDISNCQFTIFYKYVKEHQMLTTLKVNDSQIDQVHLLTKIEKLHIITAKNSFNIPEQIINMAKLNVLIVEGCEEVIIPQAFITKDNLYIDFRKKTQRKVI